MKKTEQTRTIFWISSLVAGALFSTGILVSVAVPAHAVLAPISLGAADSFAVLAGGAITNTAPTGNTLVNGDLGTYPNAATFLGATSATISGTNYGASATAQSAQTSLAAANAAITALSAGSTLIATMSGTLNPGVHDQVSAVSLATTLTFDGQGDSSSVFVIRVVGAMTTAAASSVILLNGAQSRNIFWKITGATTLGAGSTFRGNLLGAGAITVGAGTVVDGRLLTELGALTMASNTITKPASAPTSYNVTFDGNTSTGGSTSAQSADTSTALTSNGFSKSGYTFGGWNTAANGSGSAYANSATYLFTASTTLYAQWSATSNSVTYSLNAGTGSLPTQASVATAGTFTLAASTGITKTGYTFGGWSDGSSVTAASTSYTMGTSAITLTAQWAAITSNTITWDNQGATTGVSTGGSTSYTTGLTITALPTVAPTKTGYTFTGWFSATSGGSAVTAGYTPLTPFGSITIYAQWSPTSQSVSYALSAGSGSLPTQASVATAGTFTLAASTGLTKTGYTFGGWSDGSNIYSAGATYTMGTSAITLTAVWSGTSNTVTYDSQSGTSVSSGSFTTGTALTLATAPTRTGYTFTGWFVAATGGSALTTGYSPTNTSSFTLYAQWSATSNTVTYSLNGGAGSLPTQANVLTAGTFTSAASTGITKTGYTFDGWSDGSSTTAASTSYTMGTSAITLTAQWSAVTSSSITWDNQSATTGVSTGGSTSYTTGLTITALPTVAPTKTGYTFTGWFSTSSGGSAVTAGYTPLTPFGSITIYAQWSAGSNSVIYDSQAGTSVGSGSFTTGTALTLAAAPTRTGYTFTGWFVAATGGSALVSGYSPTNTSSFTLYAQWSPTSQSVTYALSAGSGSLPTQINVATAGTFTLAASTGLTKAGYTFNGWSDGSNIYSAGTTYTMGATAITLSAQWAAGSNTVTYDSQSGTSVASGSFTTGTALTLPAAPTRTGYTFTGWFVAASGGSALVSGYSPTNTSSFTLYAQWSVVVVTSTPGPTTAEINAALAAQAADKVAVAAKAAADRAAVQAAVDKAAVDKAAVDKAAVDKAAADRDAAAKAAAEVVEIARSVPSRIPAVVGQVTPGASLATANGVFIPTTLRIIPPSVEAADVRAVEIAGDGWKVAIATTNSVAGGLTMGRFDEFVVLEKGAVSSTDGAGFKPGSTVRLRLFSIPSLLGEAIVKADGTFFANWSIAASKPTGEHTLQVEGISPSGSLIRAEIGVLVRANSPKKAILLDQVFYNTSIWRLTSENKKKLNSVAKKINASKYSGILLYGFTDAATGLDNMRLSGQRNNSVKTYLQQLLPGVSIKAKSFGAANPTRKGRDKASLAFNRRVEILGQA